VSARYGSIEDRFWRDIWFEPNTGCWLFAGPSDDFGYGRIREGAKKIRTHRLSYRMHKGEIPDGVTLMHSCDIPCCCNPDHLIPGTNAENIADMDRKRRRSIGEAHNSKLTEDQVRAIRSDPRTHRAIGASYGIAHSTVGNIKRGMDWAHVA
jgi:hypothetical protein